VSLRKVTNRAGSVDGYRAAAWEQRVAVAGNRIDLLMMTLLAETPESRSPQS
jgi:hypothetical protein